MDGYRQVMASVLVALSFGTWTGAQAGDWLLGGTAGTLGFGAEAGYDFNDRLGFRAGAQAFSFGFDGRRGNVDYDSDFRLRSAVALLDLRPFAGRFTLTGGLVINGNRIDGHGRPTEDEFRIGGQTYTAEEIGQLDARVDFDRVVPYAGLGWRFGARERSGFGFRLDLGVVFQGSPDPALSASGGSISDDPMVTEALRAEEEAFADAIDRYEYYPVATAALFYRF